MKARDSPKVVRRPAVKNSGYLDEDALLLIFSCDKKTAPDIKMSEYLQEINNLSDSDNDESANIDIAIEKMLSASGEELEEGYVVQSNIEDRKGGRGLISRMESDIYVGKNEGKRFNVPSVIKKVEDAA